MVFERTDGVAFIGGEAGRHGAVRRSFHDQVPFAPVGLPPAPGCILLSLFLICFILAPEAQGRQETVDTLSVRELQSYSLEDLMNIEVTSVARRPERLSESPSPIQVITNEEIRRSGASDIPEALRLAGNLAVAQKGAHDWGISARGFNTSLANKLLVLIDGRSVYTPLYSGVFWDVQDVLLNDIDRMEVISGPGGSLWGANAVNGVINITSKSAWNTRGMYGEVGGGNQLTAFGGLRYGGLLSPIVAFRVYGKLFKRAGDVLADGSAASDSWNSGRGGFRVDTKESHLGVFTVQGDYYRGQEDVVTGNRANVAGGNIIGRWSRTFSASSDMTLEAYYDRTHLVDPTPALVINATELAPAGIFQEDLDTYNLELQHRWKTGGNRIVWGFGVRHTHDALQNSPGLAFFPAILDRNLYSLFAQDEVAILHRVVATVGSKLEHNDYTGFEYEPTVRLRWDIGGEHMLWAAVSRAVRMPSRIDRDLSEGAPPYFVLLTGNPGFLSETVVAYEAGYRAQPVSSVVCSISSFYNVYDRLRSTILNPATTFPLSFENGLRGETYGMELSAQYRPRDFWQLTVCYDFIQEQIRIKAGETDFNNALNETADPEHQACLRSSLDISPRVLLDAGLRWVDVLHNNNGPTVGSVPAYFELDLRLGWDITKTTELSVVGQNLLHDHHPEYGYPGPGREEIRRGVYGKISYSF